MRIKVDENLPHALPEALSRMGHDVDTIPGEGLTGMPGDKVFDAAQREGRFLITQDLDYSDIRRFAPGTHSGILIARLNTPGREALLSRIHSVFASENVSGWIGCFVIVTDHKIRVRHPAER